ncbi:MAG: hypothetical protein JST26_07275 [Bacteroidetes bacterium]|nr:hypothetical protein [Bacteroidota bacterium]
MKKTLSILVFMTLVSLPVFASYIGTSLPALVEKSDIIVYGRILSVNKESFRILTIRKIKSFTSGDTLTLQKFANWSCASRYTSYKAGQEAIYFIQTDTAHVLRVMGAANEGELVVKEKVAYIASIGNKAYPAQKVDFLSKYTTFVSLSLETVLKGLQIYLDNLEQITRELNTDSPGKIAYQYSYIEKLPKNVFLDLLIEQKRLEK